MRGPLKKNFTITDEHVRGDTEMASRVIQVVVVAMLSVMGVGCATSTHGPRHTVAEVELALHNAERSTLTRMADSIDPETAVAARRIARGESGR
jgi:hypothetical protein